MSEAPEQVCVDANLVIARLLGEPLEPQVLRLREQWRQDGTRMIAPPLFWAEVPSGIRRRAHRRTITPEEAQQAFKDWQQWPVSLQAPPELTERAWYLANLTAQPRVYDAQYLALAQLAGCDLWTTDERLYNGTHHRLPFVHWVGELAP